MNVQFIQFIKSSIVHAAVKIQCEHQSRFHLSNITTVNIAGIEFIGCCGNKIELIGQLWIEKATFLGQDTSQTPLELINTTAVISNSSFNSNIIGTLKNITAIGNQDKHVTYAGGAIIIVHSNISIIDSMFQENSAEVGGAVFGEFSNIKIINNTFIKNHAVSQNNDTQCYGGALYFQYGCTVVISDCSFYKNGEFTANDDGGGGGAIAVAGGEKENINPEDNGIIITVVGVDRYSTMLKISRTDFTSNLGFSCGGAIYAWESTLNIVKSDFTTNKARRNGGAICTYYGSINISSTTFMNNNASTYYGSGGALYVHSGNKNYVERCEFTNNSAADGGAINLALGSFMYITMTTFYSNVANQQGGAISVNFITRFKVRASTFACNEAKDSGGAIFIVSYLISSSTIDIQNSTFVYNKAKNGGAIKGQKIRFLIVESRFNRNMAGTGIINVAGSKIMFDNITLLNNTGSLLLFSSDLTLSKTANIYSSNNSPKLQIANGTTIKEGGAITAIQSDIVIHGTCILVNNHADEGGAIQASGSKIFVYGKVTIAKNTATDGGGGFHLYQSELTCKEFSHLEFINNTARYKGGGVHAISSLILLHLGQHTNKLVQLIMNNATYGGGMYLSVNAKIYILKFEQSREIPYPLSFFANLANFGGAIYVADDTNSATCASKSHNVYSTNTECFIQSLALTDLDYSERFLAYVNFTNNVASKSGSILHGGLLDRCTVSPFAEAFHQSSESNNPKQMGIPSDIYGLTYFEIITRLNKTGLSDVIGSHPIKICFCENSTPDCKRNVVPHVSVKKGERFVVTLVAVNQVNYPINATIHSSLSSVLGGLGEDQASQNVTNTCTDLNFTLFSPFQFEILTLYAEGPCKDSELSQSRVRIHFKACSCPVGFQPKTDEKSQCVCECDSKLRKFISECHEQNQTLVREGTFWIAHLNTTGDSNHHSYLTYPYCPLDYCYSPTLRVYINLNNANGSDEQCNFNRHGILCGRCRSGYSLSIGSSRCLSCSKKWSVMICILLFTAASLAGIVLVAILLMLNLTVATGAINGIVFYANIINANSHTFFPFAKPNFITVFIAWLNLELGIDSCLFQGMDTYLKTLLQLLFPVYIIFLVVMVIWISERSTRFARLIGTKDPVATLATLVLLSYTKMIHTIIAALSFSVLDYPNGIREIVWLPDGNVVYLHGKHMVLFLIAIIILIVGAVYTILLFSWQWLVLYQHHNILRWLKHDKLYLFLEPYFAPYNFKHRYWTGLLLVVRVVLYLASALNVSGAPGINLLVTGIVMIILVLLKGRVEVYCRVYKKILIDILETVCYMNVTLLSFASLYVLEAKKNQQALAYISGIITLILFIVVIFYHSLFEVGLWQKLRNTYRLRNGDGSININELGIPYQQCTNIELPTVTWVERPHDDYEFPNRTETKSNDENNTVDKENDERYDKTTPLLNGDEKQKV